MRHPLQEAGLSCEGWRSRSSRSRERRALLVRVERVDEDGVEVQGLEQRCPPA